jgi:hypothetical protein
MLAPAEASRAEPTLVIPHDLAAFGAVFQVWRHRWFGHSPTLARSERFREQRGAIGKRSEVDHVNGTGELALFVTAESNAFPAGNFLNLPSVAENITIRGRWTSVGAVPGRRDDTVSPTVVSGHSRGATVAAATRDANIMAMKRRAARCAALRSQRKRTADDR